MKSAFNLQTGKWQINWPGRVARHDVVYHTPPSDPMQGMPVGNGDVGVLAWCEESKVILAINKCDLWDDAQSEHFRNWQADQEDYSTTLRHACRIIIDFQMPVFDLFYLSDFQGRISLANGRFELAVSGPFGTAAVSGFVSHQEGTLCLEINSSLEEEVPVEITMERYGSRTFSHWYHLINRDANIGLADTQASADRSGLYIEHQLTSGKFAVGCRLTEGKGLKTSHTILHKHAAQMTISGAKNKRFRLVAAVTSPLARSAKAVVKQKLAEAEEKGWDRLLRAHKRVWKRFWLRSLMESGDDYLDNLWHLTMYYAAASQGGPYPGRFINGLWTWNRDVQNWNFYFHWNQQMVYWPLNPAGHHDLCESYLEYRFNGLPHAQADAREIFHTDGAVVSDVCDRRGYNSAGELSNHTPVAEIALDFWRQYQFTGDRDFLQHRALPYLVEAAKFFESLLEKGEDGLYHARDGTAYEGWIHLHDCMTELAYARVLFTAAVQALQETGAEEPRAARWQEILDNLAPLPVMKADLSVIGSQQKKLVLKRGQFQGEETATAQILGVGWGLEEQRILGSRVPVEKAPSGPASYLQVAATDVYDLLKEIQLPGERVIGCWSDMACNHGIFPNAELSPVFPAGLVGVGQAGSPLFVAAVNTAKLFAPEVTSMDTLPIILARLGLGRETGALLDHWADRSQPYCNGWGQYGLQTESLLPFNLNLARDAASSGIKDATWKDARAAEDLFAFPSWPFRHMGFESMSILATAMNEVLLQSHDGVLRVAPATPDAQNARFTLHARGGFVVSAEIQKGRPRWIVVESQLGNTCRLQNPWPKAYLYENGTKLQALGPGIVEFPTSKNRTYVVVRSDRTVRNWETVARSHAKNQRAKLTPTGRATIGLPRMF